MITHDLGVVAEIARNVMVMYAGQVVEYADVNTIFDNPQHPYTKGLLLSIPRLDTEQEKLHVIKGMVPSLNDMPAGCRFAPRCPYAEERCICEWQDLQQIDEAGHKVRCWKAKLEGGINQQ